MSNIRGVLDRIFHRGDEFFIGMLEDGTKVIGNYADPVIGVVYAFNGVWGRHPTYGRQFKFTSCVPSLPAEANAVRTYLAENAKWLGEKRSEAIIELYGDKALQICKDDPERVARDIKGITLDRANEISEMLKVIEGQEHIQVALNELFEGLQVSTKARNRMIARWRGDVIDVIRQTPYALVNVVGIGFLTADRVALRVGIDHDDPERVKAAIIHVLTTASQMEGHTYLPELDLVEAVCKLITIAPRLVSPQIQALVLAHDLVWDECRVYLQRYFAWEREIAEILYAKTQRSFELPDLDLEGLAPDQQEAMYTLSDRGVVIITGAPGTGKTYTLLKILSSFGGKKLVLAAPTGKAAKRMMEQTLEAGVTIHRLLEPKISESGQWAFTRNADNPIDADVIVLDECSMIDTWLMVNFLRAVSKSTRLIFIGDHYQLPSVGPGNVLRDLIDSGAIPFIELTQIKRQEDEAGLIIRNCHRIKDGSQIEFPPSTTLWGESDFYFIQQDSVQGIRDTIVQLLYALPTSYQLDRFVDIQVLTPLREKTEISCRALNDLLQGEFNPKDPEELRNFFIRVGDKVIQTKNDYKLDIMNGDLGTVAEINTTRKEMDIIFEVPRRMVSVPLYENSIELAYALTVHKFQGSESAAVILPIHKSCGALIPQRNWLYTAVSRAKKLCILVGQSSEVPKIISRIQQARRNTSLNHALEIANGW